MRTLLQKHETLVILLALSWTMLLQCALGQAVQRKAIDLDAQRMKITQVDANWRFHAGDDPRWALRDFDDTGWTLFQPRKDWPAQGYSAVEKLAWFRFRLRVPVAMQAVVLQLPRINRNYQLFADGKLIGQMGHLLPESGASVTPAARVFTLPAQTGDSSGSREIQIALRLQQDSNLAGVRPNVLRGRTVAGDAATVLSLFATGKNAALLTYGSDYTQDVIETIVGGAGLLLFWLTRQRFYLWFAASLSIMVAQLPWRIASEHFAWAFLFTFSGYMLIDLFSMVTFAFFLLGTLQVRGWTIRLVVVALTALAELGPLSLLLWNLPQNWADAIYLVFTAAANFLLIAYLVRGWGRAMWMRSCC